MRTHWQPNLKRSLASNKPDTRKGVTRMAKILRASVMRKSEWDKERDAEAWRGIGSRGSKAVTLPASIFGGTAQRFIQATHIEGGIIHDFAILKTWVPP